MLQERSLKYFSLFFALNFSIIIITMHGFYLNEFSAAIFRPIRYMLMGIVGIFSIILLWLSIKKFVLKKATIISVSIYILLFLYGMVASVVNGGFFLLEPEHFISSLFSLVLITISSIYISFLKEKDAKDIHMKLKKKSNIVLLFFIVGTSYLLISEALFFNPLPQFNFFIDGERKFYSQGTTFLFGVAATYFFYSSSQALGLMQKIYFFFSFGFMCLSISAGARGEFLVFVIVFFLMAFRFYGFKSLIYIFLICILLFAYVNYIDLIDWESIPFIYRMSMVLSGQTLGLRDLFLIDSINLLKSNIMCAVTGCGFNFFQSFYGYEFGRYPHNIISELSITYGLIFTTILLISALCGIVKGYFMEISGHYIYYLYIFIFGISLKSGSLFSIGYTSSVAFFILIAMVSGQKR